MNLYNFMDGIDGYAISECIFVSFSSALIFLESLVVIFICTY